MDKKLRLLFVDDEDQLRLVVSDQLQSEGYDVETADDGDTALVMIKKNKYDLILLDIRMPRVSGIEVLKYLKEHKVSSRVIMLTAVDDLSIALESIKNGANDYLTKPYDLDNLLTCIRRVTTR
ncbi:MAG: response regulator [Ignavibacteria bacterium]|nr:response regulator [Ignavibacteria bacterium]MBI3765063.1 response regulator [Ignavibacteriales bacterium]